MNTVVFKKGMHDGIPIGIAYFAVSFSLGIFASIASVTPIQGFVASLFTLASAGEAAGFRVIASGSPYIEMFFITLVSSCRYFLMSAVVSQRLKGKGSTLTRIAMGSVMTDEIFGLTIAQTDTLRPEYTYGLASVSAIPWAVGTALGITVGSVVPTKLVIALSISLYGMFIAIIIPTSKKDKNVFFAVIVAFALSLAWKYIPILKGLSFGVKICILTIVITTAFSLEFPHKENSEVEV